MIKIITSSVIAFITLLIYVSPIMVASFIGGNIEIDSFVYFLGTGIGFYISEYMMRKKEETKTLNPDEACALNLRPGTKIHYTK